MGQSALPVLIRALDSGNRDVRWEAAKAIGEIGDPSAAAALVSKLDHDYFGIRWLAAEGLITFGRQVLEPLLSALLHDPDAAFLRNGAHHVLYALCDEDPSLRDILAPLVGALGAFGGAGEIIPYVQAALKAISDKGEETHREVSDNAA
jgi:HEAT repeat protein